MLILSLKMFLEVLVFPWRFSLESNANVPHYMDFVFIFAHKFLSHNGAIMFFHSNDLQVIKEIKELLHNYSMPIEIKWAILNNFPLIITKDLGLKVFPRPISCQFCYAIIDYLFQSSTFFYLLANST